ncbi:hypothetical protein ACL07V_36705 [Streptomyces sp. MB22_4]|uniref:hypothetical protein n=1 Tax=Streptomyces TaxID=1883 RepID=UPI0033A67474
MRDQRAEEFARCAVVLAAELRETRRDDAVPADPEEADPFAAPAPTGDDPFAPLMAGREGVFDQALSNGLAAIVASEWPGKEVDRKGRVLSASALLKVIEERIPATDGIVCVPDEHPMPDIPQGDTNSLFQAGPRLSSHTRIDVRTLQNGIEASQAARHGRGAGALQHRHIEALLALDGHPSLGVMGEEQQDRIQRIAQAEDVASQKRAGEYLERIGEEEATRRAENVANPNAYHPKRNPDGHDLDTCPVCGHETFCVEGLDPIFGQVAYGQCLVCTYARTPGAAEDEAFTEHLRSIMNDE